MKPKFTDLHRYPRGYTAGADVAATFERIRKERLKQAERKAANEAEQKEKIVAHIEPKARKTA